MTNYDFDAMRKRDSEKSVMRGIPFEEREKRDSDLNDQENIRRIKLREAEWNDVRSRMEAGSDKKVDNHLRPCMEIWEETHPDLMMLEPREFFDEAIVGIVERINLSAFCYDTQEVLDIIQHRIYGEGCSPEEALEHFEFNIRGSYVGEHSPVFLERNV